MERLVTKTRGSGPAVPTEIDMDFAFDLDRETFNGLQMIFNQLCAVTDILGDDYDIDRLRELIEADRDGRCEVFPCKVGDTVYSIREDFYNKKLNSGLQIGKVTAFEFNRSCNVMWVHLKNDTPTTRIAFKIKEIGKTVFLSREEAEAALRRMQDES